MEDPTENEKEIDGYLGIKRRSIDEVYNTEKPCNEILRDIHSENLSQGWSNALIVFVLFLANFFG